MAKKIDAMHQKYGRYSGCMPQICGECSNFKRYRYRGKNYKKCSVYGESHSEATDWNVSFEACEMFNKNYEGMPIIDILKRSLRPKNDELLDGQITFNELIGGD